VGGCGEGGEGEGGGGEGAGLGDGEVEGLGGHGGGVVVVQGRLGMEVGEKGRGMLRLVRLEERNMKVLSRYSQDAPRMDPGSSSLHPRFDVMNGKPRNGLMPSAE